MKFSRLPVELHHIIFCFMDPEDILALRKAIYKSPLFLDLMADLSSLSLSDIQILSRTHS